MSVRSAKKTRGMWIELCVRQTPSRTMGEDDAGSAYCPLVTGRMSNEVEEQKLRQRTEIVPYWDLVLKRVSPDYCVVSECSAFQTWHGDTPSGTSYELEGPSSIGTSSQPTGTVRFDYNRNARGWLERYATCACGVRTKA